MVAGRKDHRRRGGGEEREGGSGGSHIVTRNGVGVNYRAEVNIFVRVDARGF